MTWQHQVSLGVYTVQSAYEYLNLVFPHDEESFDERAPGDTACAAVVVDSDGRLLLDTPTLSTCAWGIGRTRSHGPDDPGWLHGVDCAQAEFVEDVRALVTAREVSGAPDALDADAVVRLLWLALGCAGLIDRRERPRLPGPPTVPQDGTHLGGASGGAGDTGSLARSAGALEKASDVLERIDRWSVLLSWLGMPALPLVSAVVSTRQTVSTAAGLLRDLQGMLRAVERTRVAPSKRRTDDDGSGTLSVSNRGAAHRPDDSPGDTADSSTVLGATEFFRRLGALQVRVVSRQVPARSAEGTSSDFLNSFLLEDLERVRAAIEAGAEGPALRAYLGVASGSRPDPVRRVDVRDNLDAVRGVLAPGRIPAGRWPSNPQHPLALGQQLAVHLALGLPDTGGILGVNGPPGTGKTTMLRDIVAANVTERARRIARLPRPSRALVGTLPAWQADGYPRRLHRLNPDLTGFEMIVASSNNGAVENVTTELPGLDSLAERWRDGTDYLRAVSDRLAVQGSESGTAAPTWGLVSVRLGRRALRAGFRSVAWFDDQTTPSSGSGETKRAPGGPAPDADGSRVPGRTAASAPLGAGVRAAGPVWDAEAPDSAPSDAAMEPAAPGQPEVAASLQAWLRQAETTGPRCTWAQAVAEFRRAQDRVDRMIAQRRCWADALAAHGAAMASLGSCRQHLWEAERGVAAADETLGRSAARRITADRAVQHARDDLDDSLRGRPRFWENLSTVGRASRDWRPGHTDRLALLQVAQQEAEEATREHDDAVEGLAAARCAVSAAAQAAAGAAAYADRLTGECREGAQALGEHWPDSTWVADENRRELHAPWLDPVLDEARSELFLAALRLHLDLLAHEAKRFRESLRAAIDVVGGAAPSDLDAERALAAWQMLFLVVPVVSSTFASFGRCFAALGGQAFGWLLIDEAGQATPQAAAGAVWRTRHVVAVGDPLQLTPVVRLPARAEGAIAARYGVGPQWRPRETSVQGLADAATAWGTALSRDDGGTLWVGSPLRVHRRCDRPMIDICNTVAYDGLMINGVHRGKDSRLPETVPSSRWLDVRSTRSIGHLVPEEIETLTRCLDDLKQRCSDLDIIMISPFVHVADELHDLARQYDDGDPDNSGSHDSSAFGAHRTARCHTRGGTVHTAQGKEADIVFFVLGGDPRKTRAMEWAASTPNLINVATSRARQRLYVIGNQAAWSRHQYFSTLAKLLGEANRAPDVASPTHGDGS